VVKALSDQIKIINLGWPWKSPTTNMADYPRNSRLLI